MVVTSAGQQASTARFHKLTRSTALFPQVDSFDCSFRQKVDSTHSTGYFHKLTHSTARFHKLTHSTARLDKLTRSTQVITFPFLVSGQWAELTAMTLQANKATAPPSTSTAPLAEEQLKMEGVRYQVSGCAAHGRLLPLLPTDWIDQSSSSTSNNASPINFLWENAPRNETRSYRDTVQCYSHLPNGTAVLDDKWALARLFSFSKNNDKQKPHCPHLATLESHCFRGITGFQSFCNKVNMNSENQEEESTCGEEGNIYQFPDLLNENEPLSQPPPPAPSNLWVVKDANSNGAGGIWIVGPQNANAFQNESTTPLLQEHRYVAQRYAWPPVLYGGRKCHVRVYGLLTSDGRAFVHKRAFLHVANESFSYATNNGFCKSVHITNCCANSHDESKFAGEICANLEATADSVHEDDSTVPLGNFYPSIAASVAELAQRAFPFLRGGQANNGFEYLGMDFILSYNDDGEPIAYMLEVNAPPSQDTATGLEHAEMLHDEVIRDVLTLWVYPNVMPATYVEKPGGWKCVHDERNDCDNQDDSLIVPSKAAILNKIRWAIFERKSSRLYDEQEPTGADETTQAGKELEIIIESPTKLPSADTITSFARSQFPYFSDEDSLSTSTPPRQIFFENAGGAQVPNQVIQAVANSLAHRNRSVEGTRQKKAARDTLYTILGANDSSHVIFLGANATSLFEKLARVYVDAGLLSRDDEIVISTENHLANVTPWMMAAQSVGARVKWWHVQGPAKAKRQEISEPSCNSLNLRDLLSTKTRILAVSHASNILGQVRNLKSICKLAKEMSGGYAHVVADGVATVPHLSPSVSKTGVDWYAISCHKLFGPHLGALCGRRDIARLLLGNDCQTADDEILYKTMETGTINYEACAGAEGLGRYFEDLATFHEQSRTVSNGTLQTKNQNTGSQLDRCENLSPRRLSPAGQSPTAVDESQLTQRYVMEAYNRIRLAEAPLVDTLYRRLGSCDNVHIMESEDSAQKLPVFSIRHRVIASSEIVQACADARIACRQSTFLCTRLLQRAFGFGAGSLGGGDEDGVVRVSLAHYNTMSEVNRLMDALESLPNWR